MILGLIPARGGSKRIPGKNAKLLGGKPLVAWTIEAALTSGSLGRVVVSTDDADIAYIARDWGCEDAMRPAFLATDTASLYDVVRYHLKYFEADAVMLLHPTSPFRTADDIDGWFSSPLVQSREEGHLKANGAIYLAAAHLWRDRRFTFDGNSAVHWYDMPPERSLDINTPEDWARAEAMVGG